MAAKSDYVQVVLLDRKEPLLLPKQKNNESLWRLAARQGLGVRPSALELFGKKIRKKSSNHTTNLTIISLNF